MTLTTITGVAIVRPATAAAPARDTAGLTGAWFEAPTSGGPVRLYASGTARHASDAAVALARCDALLDALDAWFGAALDWRWIAAPASVTATASHARAHWRPEPGTKGGKKELACRLELPWALLRTLPAPDTALAQQLHWLDVPVVLAIAQLRVGEEELALLEPGGAVVLPESMQRNWIGTLRALDEPARAGAGVPVSLPSPWSPRRIKAGARAETGGEAAGNRVLCEVRLAIPHAVAGDRLAGWYEGDLGEVGPRAGLWRCATERAPAACLATGELMPLGDGWALALQELYEIRQTSQ
jgi:hypothetical protein